MRPVQLYGERVLAAGHLLQLFPAADAYLLAAVLTLPDRERGAPVAVAADAPVLHVLEPVAEAAGANAGRDPVDGIVVGDKVIAHGGHLDEPGFPCVVDERRVAAPAVRIFMLKFRRGEKLALRLQVFEDHRVRLLDEPARVRSLLRHIALAVHELDEGQVIGASDAAVILTESRCDMYDAGTVGHGDIVIDRDEVRGLVLLFGSLARALEQRLVRAPLQVCSAVSLKDFVGGIIPLRQRAEHLVSQRLRQDIGIAVRRLHLDVGLVRVDAQRGVAGQGPRSRGPRKVPDILLVQRLEADDRGALFYQLVALRNFLRGKRRAAARAVGHDLKALVEELLLPDLLQGPPFGFDVVIVVGDVRIIHIRPETDRVGEFLPHAFIFPDRFLALLNERLHAVRFDLFLAVDADLMLDGELDRQSVGIPAGFARHVGALHDMIARDHILDHAGQDMADVRLSVCRGRSVVKCVVRRPLALFIALSEDVVFLPESVDVFFPVNKVQVGVYFVILHSVSSLGRPFSSAALWCGCE